jgi:hypothetical protein
VKRGEPGNGSGSLSTSTMFPSREGETRVALMADVCELDRSFLSGGANA